MQTRVDPWFRASACPRRPVARPLVRAGFQTIYVDAEASCRRMTTVDKTLAQPQDPSCNHPHACGFLRATATEKLSCMNGSRSSAIPTRRPPLASRTIHRRPASRTQRFPAIQVRQGTGRAPGSDGRPDRQRQTVYENLATRTRRQGRATAQQSSGQRTASSPLSQVPSPHIGQVIFFGVRDRGTGNRPRSLLPTHPRVPSGLVAQV